MTPPIKGDDFASVTPVPRITDHGQHVKWDVGDDLDEELGQDDGGIDETAGVRINLTTPSDRENELLKMAAQYGPPGILAVIRSRRDYSWITVLGLRAIEVCLAPRTANSPSWLRKCDPVAFAMVMMEMEMIDEIFMLMKKISHIKAAQRAGLAIVELLTMDDPQWRDEVARKGGVRLVCDVAKEWKESPQIMCSVMTCMSYLAAEDYIEIMLCQHDALAYVTHALRQYEKNAELVTRACLALLNLTACGAHVEELVEKDAVLLPIRVLTNYPSDMHVVIIVCGVLANLSVNHEAREQLARGGVFHHVQEAMRLDPGNAVLQVACLKSLVNYSNNPDHYIQMEKESIPTLVGQVMIDHGDDPAVQKYGNIFLGETSSCSIL